MKRLISILLLSFLVCNVGLYAKKTKGQLASSSLGITFDNPDLAEIRTKLCKILQKVCNLESQETNTISGKCDVIITQQSIPLTITEPGLYCLTEDVTSSGPFAILIDSDCVVIDMCHHVIDGNNAGADGIKIAGPHDGIAILNGTFKNLMQGIADLSDNTVLSNLFFHNLNFDSITADVINMGANITTNDVSNIVVDNVTTTQSGCINIRFNQQAVVQNCVMGEYSGAHGIVLRGLNVANSGQQAVVDNCIVQPGGGAGITCENVANALVKNSEAAGLLQEGFLMTDVATSVLTNCVAQECDLDGFKVEHNAVSLESCIMRDCQAQTTGTQAGNNNHGFSFIGANNFDVQNIKLVNCCTQNGNGSGFEFELQGTANLDNVVLQNCTAQNNARAGFELLTDESTTNAITNLEFENCTAQNSGADGFSFRLRNTADTLDHALFTNCLSQDSTGGSNVAGQFYEGDGFNIGIRFTPTGICSDLVFINCVAQNNNADGFDFADTHTVYMKGCMAIVHDASFITKAGFEITGVFNRISNIVLEDCQSQAEFQNGFLFDDVDNLSLINCSNSNSLFGLLVRDSNGISIDNFRAQENSTVGLSFARDTNLSINNSTAQDSDTGFSLINVHNASITNCKSIGDTSNLDNGFGMNKCSNVLLKNCDSIRNFNGFSLFSDEIFNGENYTFINCCAINNTNNGFLVSPFFESFFSNIVFEKCDAQDNTGLGFYCEAPFGSTVQNIVYKDCVAQGNDNCGFELDSFDPLTMLRDVVFENCVAQNNANDGFKFDLFDFNTTGTVTMKCCIANVNAENGFIFRLTNNIVLEQCVAQGNEENGFEFPTTKNVHLESCKSLDSGGINFNFGVGNNLNVVNCHALRSRSNDGFALTSVNNISMVGCVAQDNVVHGFDLNTITNASFTNCDSIGNEVDGFCLNNIENLVFINCNSIGQLGAGYQLLTNSGTGDKNLKFIDCSAINNTGQGFLFQSLRDIENILFKNCVAQSNTFFGFAAQAIGTTNMTNLVFDNCVAQQSSSGGFLIDHAGTGELRNVVINDCVSQENGTVGFVADAVENIDINCSVAQDNGSHGFQISETNNAALQNSQAIGNGAHGFLTLDVNNLTTQDCESLDNTSNGFTFDTTTKGSIIDCTANGNVVDGFELAITTTCIKLLDNCAVGNDGIGFEDLAPLGSNFMLGNSAFCNVTQYSGAGIEPRLRASGNAAVSAASRWDNIDV